MPTLKPPARAPGPRTRALAPPLPPISAQPPAGAGITRAVLKLAWPAVVEQILFAGVDLTDLYIVGHLGAAALSAVGLTGLVVMLSIAFFGAIATGCMALVARHIGAGEHADAGRTLQQSLVSALVLGGAACAIAWLFAPDILAALGAEPDVVELGAPFMRAIAVSLPLTAIGFAGMAAMRAAGDTRTPMQLTGLQLVVNAVLGVALVYGPPHMGVLGSGIATMIARSVTGLRVMWLLWRRRGGVRLSRDGWKPDGSRLRRILNVGLPAGAEQVLLQFALINLAVVIAGLGTVTYAAHNVAMRIISLSFLPGWGFAIAASTLVGQGLGANDPRRARDSAYAAFRWALGVMAAMGVALYVLGEPIARLFTGDEAVIAASLPAMHVGALAQPFMATSFVFMNSLRGAGDTRITLIITVASIWLVRLGAAYLGAHVLGWGLAGAWLGILADFACRGLFGWLRFRGGKWQTLKV